MEELTTDAMFDGALELAQRRRGYRFGIDAVLLGGGLGSRPGRRVLDLGAGCGVVGLTVAHLSPATEVVAVEVQPALAALARRNASANRLEGRVRVIEADARDVARWRGTARSGAAVADVPEWLDLVAEGFETVLINPPFFGATHGLRSPDGERAAARHQLFGELTELLRAGRLLANAAGTVRVIYPAERLVELLRCTAEAGLKPSRLRPIHSYADTPAELVVLDARAAGRQELQLAPPLVLYDAPNTYTEVVRTLLRGAPIVV